MDSLTLRVMVDPLGSLWEGSGGSGDNADTSRDLDFEVGETRFLHSFIRLVRDCYHDCYHINMHCQSSRSINLFYQLLSPYNTPHTSYLAHSLSTHIFCYSMVHP